jgi:hypothetical protein
MAVTGDGDDIPVQRPLDQLGEAVFASATL